MWVEVCLRARRVFPKDGQAYGDGADTIQTLLEDRITNSLPSSQLCESTKPTHHPHPPRGEGLLFNMPCVATSSLLSLSSLVCKKEIQSVSPSVMQNKVSLLLGDFAGS